MTLFANMRLFQKAATGIFCIFMGLMVLVCIAAYSRPSGSTRQDMAQAQFARIKSPSSFVNESEPVAEVSQIKDIKK